MPGTHWEVLGAVLGIGRPVGIFEPYVRLSLGDFRWFLVGFGRFWAVLGDLWAYFNPMSGTYWAVR